MYIFDILMTMNETEISKIIDNTILRENIIYIKKKSFKILYFIRNEANRLWNLSQKIMHKSKYIV